MSEGNDIFASVKYFVTGTLDEKVQRLLERGGATRRKFLVDFVTHVICGKDFDESQVAEAQDLYDLPAVDEKWVLISSKLGRLASTTPAYDPLPNKLFSNLTFALSGGLTPNDNKILYGVIEFHGGVLLNHYTERTSILICPSATGAAYAKAMAVGNERTKIVTPDWVMDSVKANSLLDSQKYHPRLIVSSMVIEKMMQVNVVGGGSDAEKASGDADKKPQVTQKQGIITAPIGAMIRPIKAPIQVTTTAGVVPSSPVSSAAASLPKNIVIQQQSASAQMTDRPTGGVTSGVPPMGTPVKSDSRPVGTPVEIKLDTSTMQPQIISTSTSGGTVVHVKQIPVSTQLKITQQTVPAGDVSKTQTGAGAPNTTNTVVPKPQIVNTKQIQFIQSSNPGVKQQTMLVQTSVAGPMMGQQQQSQPGSAVIQSQSNQNQSTITQIVNPVGSVQQQVIKTQFSSQPPTAVAGQGQNQGAQVQHIILSQQQLAQLQQQPTNSGGQQSTAGASGHGPKRESNILIIQQQPNTGNNNNNQVMQSNEQLPQSQQQSQSVPHSPVVQAPQFSNVQFIRSNSQPVGSLMSGGGGGSGPCGPVTTPQGQPIQLQQVNFQMNQQQPPQSGQVQGPQQQQQQQQPGIGHPPGAVMSQQMIISQQQGGGQPHMVQQQQQQWASGPQGQQTIQVQQVSGQQMPQIVGQQFVRGGAVRVVGPQQQPQQQQWVTSGPQQQQQQQGVPPRQLVKLDPQAQAWQMMDPAKKAEYIAQLQSRRNVMLRQPLQFQNRPTGPAGVVTTRMTASGQHQHIVFKGPWIHQQQQQQQQRQQILVRASGGPGQMPQQMASGLSGTTIVTGPAPAGGNMMGQATGQVVPSLGQGTTLQVQLDPNAAGAQPRPQFQRMNSLSGQNVIQQSHAHQQQQQQQQQMGGQTIQTRYVTIDGNQLHPDQQMVQVGDGVNQPQIISKTKTALANMLNSRMTGNNGGGPGTPMTDVVEPSAAGTLRLMTAHHNATLNQSMAGPRAQEMLALQQQQQRRTLGNITNASGAGGPVINQPVIGPGGQLMAGSSGPVAAPVGPAGVQLAMAAAVSSQQGPTGLKAPPYSPGRAPQPRPQFYGHNPNLPKLPPQLFLLGSNFFIVEYDETHAEDLVVWKELIRKHGGEIETLYCPRVTHVLCRSQRHGVVMQAIRDSKRCVTAHWLNDVIVKKQLLPPWQALHLPAPSTFGRQRPATRHIVAISGFEGEERQRIKKMVEETGAKLTSYFSKQNSVLVCKRLDGMKYKRAKDWGVPVVNATWLSDILMGNLSTMSHFDTAKYQQYNLNCPFRIEYGLVAHLMTSWKSPINLNQESHERLKRCHSEPPAGPKPKRPARQLPPPLETVPEVINVMPTKATAGAGIRVMFSQVENVDGLRKVVTAFGGSVVCDAADATHLVMTRFVRTVKLLQCLCTTNSVLSSDWLVDSAAVGELLPEDKYHWTFERQEKEDVAFKCDLQLVLKSPERRKLFEGRTFHLTPSVRPTVKEVTKMIELCGGTVEKKARRSLLKIHEANAQSANSYVVLSCPADLHLLSDIIRSKQHNRIICTTELVMKSIMQQTFDLEPHIIRCV